QKSATDFYSVAIADIDFFKRVNDTYGHSCGDYTLRALADLFREKAPSRVCRWGGEEFCFFLPGKNLDQAGMEMNELCLAVRNLKLNYEGHDFSITITIGVAENDFSSPIESILEEADKKLYIGKSSGRNQVVL
nr:GGDEF domain-containing protein [Oscillospiraceae bacterium]